jgi:XTP/dITP diphosphohydrolase
MKLLFASQNEHKRKEMSRLLLPHEIMMPSDLDHTFECEETADTFIGNALEKAQHLYTQMVRPTFADDSGLIIDALGGAPGIYSARYGADQAKRMLDAGEKNQLVLSQLAQVPYEKRTARFVCAMALVLTEHRIFVVQETIEGHIAQAPYGAGGFGYDPIFLVGDTDRTMASLSEQEKNTISHRALAAKRMQAIIAQLEQSEVLYVS